VRRDVWAAVGVLIGLSVLFQFLYQYGTITALSYHRDASAFVWIWQWLTPSLVHAGWVHWLFNVLNLFALIVVFHSGWSGREVLGLFGLASAGILFCLYGCSPKITDYVGMSGVLYTLAVFGAMRTLPVQKTISVLVLTYVVLKLVAHDWVNAVMGVDQALGNLSVATDVHWYGAGIGMVAVVIIMFFSMRGEGRNIAEE
jgi:rhomboid family GlyGly-CTERM serine protease